MTLTLRNLLAAALLLLAVVALPLQAKIEAYPFDDARQEALYHKLIAELRCLVCQNNNLADSNAELAQDLRRKTYNMVIAGNSYDEIISYMVQRYGDFVLYKPPVKSTTYLLWAGPFIALVIGIAVLISVIRKRGQSGEPTISDSDKVKAEDLLKGNSKT